MPLLGMLWGCSGSCGAAEGVFCRCLHLWGYCGGALGDLRLLWGLLWGDVLGARLFLGTLRVLWNSGGRLGVFFVSSGALDLCDCAGGALGGGALALLL